MSLEKYRIHFDDFDISEHAKTSCLEAMTAIIENIIEDLFNGYFENCDKQING